MKRDQVEERLIALVCDEMRVPVNEFFSRRRTKTISHARFAVMDVLHRSGLWTATEAAQAVGREEHTTTLHAKKAAAARRSCDGNFDKMLAKLDRYVSASMECEPAEPIRRRPSIWKDIEEKKAAIRAARQVNPEVKKDMQRFKEAALRIHRQQLAMR